VITRCGPADASTSADAASASRGERGQDGDRCVLAGQDVGEGDADLHRCPGRLAGDGHPPALGLDDEVVAEARAVGAEAGDRAPDQLGMALEKLGGCESASLERAGAEVVDDDVGVGDEVSEERLVLGIADVGDQTLLVSVDAQEVGALTALVERRSPAARLVTSAGPLDLEDVGAEVAEHHGTERTGEDAGEIENLEANQHYDVAFMSISWRDLTAKSAVERAG
jgi:hypothetical protein